MIFASAAVAALVGGSALAHSGDRGHGHDNDHRADYRDDYRGDYRGDRRHGPRYRGLSKHQVMKQYMRAFDRLDRNYDNRIGPREMRRAYDGRGHHHRDRYDNRHVRNNRLITERMVRRFDTNDNGFLPRREMRRGISRAFERSDRNNNGYLGPRELRDARWYRGWRPMPRQHR